MTQLVRCWKLVEIKDVKILMSRWYHAKNKWAFTKKGKKKIQEKAEIARQRLISAIHFHYPELEKQAFSWTIKFTRDTAFYFIREGHEPDGSN